MRKYMIGVLQLDTQNNKEENLKTVCGFIDEAVSKGAKLVTMPETMHCIGENVGEGGKRIEPIPGYSIGILQQKAREHGIYIHCGSISEEREGEERYYNTSVLLAPDGAIIARYRKLHTFDVTLPDGTEHRESDRVMPGKEIVDVETELGHLGLSICYDMRFPELYRILALRGAQVLFSPANFTTPTGTAHWDSILRTRAIENGCYMVAAAQIGKKPSMDAFGNSMVIDPWGTVIARAKNGPCVVMAEIDLDDVDRVRGQIPSLKNRRTDLYEVRDLT